MSKYFSRIFTIIDLHFGAIQPCSSGLGMTLEASDFRSVRRLVAYSIHFRTIVFFTILLVNYYIIMKNTSLADINILIMCELLYQTFSNVQICQYMYTGHDTYRFTPKLIIIQ